MGFLELKILYNTLTNFYFKKFLILTNLLYL